MEVDKLKFTSAAAKRDLISYLKDKKLSAENGKIIGFSDAVDLYKAENPDALATEGNPKPKFTEPNEGGNPSQTSGLDLGKMSMQDYIAARKKK